MNNFIEKINFKSVVIIYLVLLILSILSIGGFLGNIYKNKIKLLYNYQKLEEIIEDNANQNILKERINSLSKSSNDIIDIVILSNNEIVYTTNNFYKNDLMLINNTNNYYVDGNKNVYRLNSKKEFVLDLFDIKLENKDEYYNEFQIDINNKYTINYLKKDDTNEKIIIVSKISSIVNSKKYLKLSLFVIILFFMLYWIIVTLMIYQNALKLKVNAYFWGIVTLLTNFVGVICYLLFIKTRISCPNCHTNISIKSKYCQSCGIKI